MARTKQAARRSRGRVDVHAVNKVCRAYNSSYSAKFVSWNDASRQQGSCLGNNITDARLKGRHGKDFVVIRPDNFDERIGRVAAKDVAVLVGNHNDTPLRPTTLAHFLAGFGEFASYAGPVPPTASLADARDSAVGIRFQAVFIPVPEHKDGNPEPATEFYADTYNYQTNSWDNPRNVVVLCTSQGTFVQQDGPGAVPQLLHKKDAAGVWCNHYLEAMRTRHEVSLEQHESAEERQEALAKGKAVSTVIGTRSMGVGFNRLMTIQIPLKQRDAHGAHNPVFVISSDEEDDGGGGNDEEKDDDDDGQGEEEEEEDGEGGRKRVVGGPVPRQRFRSPGSPLAPPELECASPELECVPRGSLVRLDEGDQGDSCEEAGSPVCAPPRKRKAASSGDGHSHSRKRRRANAARVSFGTTGGPKRPLDLREFKRDPECSITITVQFYFVVTRGKPIEEEDIKRAIDICQEAYKGCSWDGNLMDSSPHVAFAKKDMTPSEIEQALSKAPRPAAPPLEPAFSPFFGLPTELREAVQELPLNNAAFHWIHDERALPLLSEHSQSLDTAFHAFGLANTLHVQLHGRPNPTSLYNMACCLSLAVGQQMARYHQHFPLVRAGSLADMSAPVASAGGVVAPNLPPTHENARELMEGRLEASLRMLECAIGAGFVQHAHINTDPDLHVLRAVHPGRFAELVRLAKDRSRQR